MVAVRYGPYAGVQEGVAVTVCNDEVAIIASIGEAQKAFLRDVCEQLHVLGVVDEHAAVVGDSDAACRPLAFSVMGAGVVLVEVEALGLVCAFWVVWAPHAVRVSAATAPNVPARVRKNLRVMCIYQE